MKTDAPEAVEAPVNCQEEDVPVSHGTLEASVCVVGSDNEAIASLLKNIHVRVSKL